MKIPQRDSAVNPSAAPRVHSFSPDDPPHSNRPAMRAVAPCLAQAGLNRIRFRARLFWTDPGTPSGQREEIVVFSDPRKLLTLVQQVTEEPDRPLASVKLEAIVRPRWELVPLDFLRARAVQRDRRDAERKGGAR